MRQPSEALVEQIASRLRAMGMPDAATQSRVIAALAMQLAYPEIVESARAARLAESYVRQRSAWEQAGTPGLLYALTIYAAGKDDGGAFARQTLRTYRAGRGAET